MLAQPDSGFQKTEFDVQKYALQNPRKLGTLLLAGGFGLIYWCILLPLQGARTRTSEIKLYPEGAIVGLGVILVGLGYVLLGPTAARFFRPAPGRSKALQLVAGLVIGGVALAAYLWFEHFLESLGYVFR